jgi:NAD(P)-dependent dehydrogenase (short-subunit alcohol dehydrogenase family)
MGRVQGKVALVTGGGKGLGEATCRLMAKEGAAVAVTDVDEANGKRVADAIVGAGGKARFYRHDVTSEDDWRSVAQQAESDLGPLKVVVNNAGIAVLATVEDETLEGWRKTQEVNVEGVFLGTQTAIKHMKETGGGSIINLSSIAGIIGLPALACYNASKGAVRIFTKSAALHCAEQKYGIRVNSVHPGYIETPLLDDAFGDLPNANEVRSEIVSLHPVGHIGEPSDIAYGVLYLASDEAKFVTGAELVIDGGYTAR